MDRTKSATASSFVTWTTWESNHSCGMGRYGCASELDAALKAPGEAPVTPWRLRSFRKRRTGSRHRALVFARLARGAKREQAF